MDLAVGNSAAFGRLPCTARKVSNGSIVGHHATATAAETLIMFNTG